MAIKREATVEKCDKCGSVTHRTHEINSCDNCKAVIPHDEKRTNQLEVTVFRNHHDDSERLTYCSWHCCLSHLPTVKSDYFISLPYLNYDKNNVQGCRSTDFFRALKERQK